MIRSYVFRWAEALPLSGALAIIVAIAAVAVPTALRASVTGVIAGCEFTPYLPFVLLSAFLLRWWLAGTVALIACAVMGGLFGGGQSLDVACYMSAAGMFLAASAGMIGIAVLVRGVIETFQRTHKPSGGVIFSLENDEVWASWHGQGPPVRLGSKERVAEMMQGFLADADEHSKLPRRFW